MHGSGRERSASLWCYRPARADLQGCVACVDERRRAGLAVAAYAKTAGLAASVPYYGGGMPNFKDEKPKVPTLCNFGELDQSPTPAQAKELLAKH